MNELFEELVIVKSEEVGQVKLSEIQGDLDIQLDKVASEIAGKKGGITKRRKLNF